MKNSHFVVLIIVFMVALVSAAAAPVAMRVEVEPLGSSGEETRVAVIVQVSPEDRGRIGKNPIVRIELDGEVPPGQSPMWAARMEDDGSTRVETVWPPGEHDLKVEIEDPSGEHRGLWVGRVRIPGNQSEPTPVLPTPTPSPIPTPPPMPTPTAAVPTPVPEAENVAEPEAVAATVAAASVADAAAPPQNDLSARERSAPAPTPVAEVDPAPDVDTASEPSPEAAPSPQPDVEVDMESAEVSPPMEEKNAPEPDPEPEIAESSEEHGEMERAAPVVAVGAAAAAAVQDDKPVSEETRNPADQPIVEPLRSPEPAPTTESLPAEPQPTAETGDPAQSAKAIAPETLSAVDAWQDAAPGTTDLTVIVSRDRQPVPGLQSADLNLEIGGDASPIEKIGDAENAPGVLGFAVDLSPDGVANWPQVSRSLAPLAPRVEGGLGRLFAVTGGETTNWDEATGRLDELLPNPSDGDLTGLIDRALARLGEERGRTFLVVITDGRTNPTKESWKETNQRIAEAGVPLLVIALWDESFSNKVRRGLQQLSADSGGRLFQVLGVEQLDGAVDRYGPVLDSGVALRFQPPQRSKPGPAQVSVKAGDRSIEVTAPKTIR